MHQNPKALDSIKKIFEIITVEKVKFACKGEQTELHNPNDPSPRNPSNPFVPLYFPLILGGVIHSNALPPLMSYVILSPPYTESFISEL